MYEDVLSVAKKKNYCVFTDVMLGFLQQVRKQVNNATLHCMAPAEGRKIGIRFVTKLQHNIGILIF